MNKNDFVDIAPFEGQDFEDAISRLRQYPQLINNFTDIISRHSRIVNAYKAVSAKDKLSKLLTQVHSYDDFQKKITCDLFLNMIESSSIDHLTYEGLEKLDSDKAYLFISNHRDIILDTALLDYVLNKENKPLCEMVIGDNLLVNQFTTDMFKVNGAITVKRSAQSATELRDNTIKMSSYISYCITEKNKNVWIAQKSGRSKDGCDNTSSAILKMIYLSFREQGLSFSDFLKKIKIVPVAISYQYDPCDVSKSNEEIRKLKAEGCYDVYRKKKYADVLDMVRGLRMNKGNVHIHVGEILSSDIASPKEAAQEIDRQIHNNYKLWNTNYFAYDYLNGNNQNQDKYSDLNTKDFVKKYSLLRKEVSDYVFNAYANPVRSYLSEREK